MNIRSGIMIVVIASGLLARTGYAEDAHGSAAGQIDLTPKLKSLLSQEMIRIEQGMASLVSFIAAGDLREVAREAKALRDSYIMKQQLTPEQIEELHHSLPAGFREIDHGFHRTAGKMSAAAEKEDHELVTFYFYKLNEACVACHSRYAQQRFPAFAHPVTVTTPGTAPPPHEVTPDETPEQTTDEAREEPADDRKRRRYNKWH